MVFIDPIKIQNNLAKQYYLLPGDFFNVGLLTSIIRGHVQVPTSHKVKRHTHLPVQTAELQPSSLTQPSCLARLYRHFGQVFRRWAAHLLPGRLGLRRPWRRWRRNANGLTSFTARRLLWARRPTSTSDATSPAITPTTTRFLPG